MIFMGLGDDCPSAACVGTCNTQYNDPTSNVYQDTDALSTCINFCASGCGNVATPSGSTPSASTTPTPPASTISSFGTYLKNPWVLLGLAAVIGGGIYFYSKR